jgi:Transposase
MLNHEVIRRIRCAARRVPCARCGRRGYRKRILHRRIRTLAYQRVAWLEITYAEYRACCGCRKYFRTWPLEVPPKADYDGTVRQAVLDRLLRDRLNVQQTLAAMRRDFLLKLSEGFVYDCLRWQVARLDLAVHRQQVLARFSGTLCVDEIHLGQYTVLLATDPLADLPVGFALVGANDQDHMGRFLRNLARWGLRPQLVVSDGSSLYPELLAEIWPEARHQLCIFHLLRDILNRVLDGVRRLRRGQAQRGRAGRKRRRGRPSRRQKAQRQQRGPTNREKATFLWRHRFLIVKRSTRLSREEWEDLVQMFGYLPELRSLWYFSQDIYRLLDDSTTLRVARWRYTLLKKEAKYQGVRELVEALDLLTEPKLTRAMAFVQRPAEQRHRTNNHVERMNRRLRFAEKVRYRWRKRRWVVRWLVLLLDVDWQQAVPLAATVPPTHSRAERPPPQQGHSGRKKAA